MAEEQQFNTPQQNAPEGQTPSVPTGEGASSAQAQPVAQPKPTKTETKSLPTAQQLPSLVGEEISGCEILQKTAAGGMGAVYRARHKALNRIVCVKILAPALANDKKAVDLFLTEARAIAELDHPNIVNVYNVGKEKGYYFIVMSFVEGQTLSQMLRKQKVLPIGVVLDLFEGVLLGLQAAHEKGIIHRDIKPSNILIDNNMQPKVVDFGIAKKVDKEKGSAKSTELAGTAYFIAPEQAVGKNVDTRADLYAVGASLYYVLTGHFPYNGKNTMEIIQKHIKDPIPNPANLRPEIPVWLAQAIQKLMSKKPENRFRTAKEVVDFFRKMRADDQLRVTEGNAGRAINLEEEGALKVARTQFFLPPEEKPNKIQEPPRKLMETEDLVPTQSTADLPSMDAVIEVQPPQPQQENDGPQVEVIPDISTTLEDEAIKVQKKHFLRRILSLIPFFTLMTFVISYVFYKLGTIGSTAVHADSSFLEKLYAPFFISSYSSDQLIFMGAAIACLIILFISCRIKEFACYMLTLLFLAAVSYVGGLVCPNISFLNLAGVAGNLFSASCFAGYLFLSVVMAWFIGKTYNRSLALGVLGVAFLGLSVALSYLTAHTSQPPAFGLPYVNGLLYATMGCAMGAIYYLLMPSQRNAMIMPVVLTLGAVGCMWFFTLSGTTTQILKELDPLIQRIPASEAIQDATPKNTTDDLGLSEFSQHANTYVRQKDRSEFAGKSEEQVRKMIEERVDKMVPDETFTQQTFNEFTKFLTIYFHKGENSMKWAVWTHVAQVPFQRFNEDAPYNHIYSLLMLWLILFNIVGCGITFFDRQPEAFEDD